MNVDQFKINQHSAKRIRERLYVKGGEELSYIRNLLKDADYLGKGIDAKNQVCHLYVNKKVRVMVDDNFNVKTVIREGKSNYPVKDKIATLWLKEVKKIHRKCKSNEKQLQELNLEADIELAELKLRKHRTRSESVRMVCEARIRAIRDSITEYDAELKEQFRSKVKTLEYYQRAL